MKVCMHCSEANCGMLGNMLVTAFTLDPRLKSMNHATICSAEVLMALIPYRDGDVHPAASPDLGPNKVLSSLYTCTSMLDVIRLLSQLLHPCATCTAR